jgi:hypothetical protein
MFWMNMLLRKYIKEQNFIREAIKSRSNSGNACYYSVQNFLSSRLLSENVKIGIYACGTWSLTLREERRLICLGTRCSEYLDLRGMK